MEALLPGPRVTLRTLDERDAEAMLRAVQDPELRRLTGTHRLAFAFGRLGLHRVELEVFDFNLRAQKSYAKNGFTVEGVKRDALLWDGERHDVIMMAALAPS